MIWKQTRSKHFKIVCDYNLFYLKVWAAGVCMPFETKMGYLDKYTQLLNFIHFHCHKYDDFLIRIWNLNTFPLLDHRYSNKKTELTLKGHERIKRSMIQSSNITETADLHRHEKLCMEEKRNRLLPLTCFLISMLKLPYVTDISLKNWSHLLYCHIN